MKVHIIFIFYLLINNVIFAQDIFDHNLDIVRRTRQNEFIGWHANDIMNYSVQLEVVGWSRTGLFAYRTRWSESAIPASGYELVIFDTVTDNIVVHEQISHSRWNDEIDDFEDVSETRIIEIRDRWNELLYSYGINGEIINPMGTISEGGYQVFDGKIFEVWFNYERGETRWGDEIVTWELKAEIDNRQKIVSSGTDFSDTQYGRRIIGFYKSSYENRIVILTIRNSRGFDHPVESDVSIVLFGCHLDVGFN